MKASEQQVSGRNKYLNYLVTLHKIYQIHILDSLKSSKTINMGRPKTRLNEMGYQDFCNISTRKCRLIKLQENQENQEHKNLTFRASAS